MMEKRATAERNAAGAYDDDGGLCVRIPQQVDVSQVFASDAC